MGPYALVPSYGGRGSFKWFDRRHFVEPMAGTAEFSLDQEGSNASKSDS